MDKAAQVNEILRLKEQTARLAHNIRLAQALCEEYEKENRHLQEYVGTVMKGV